MFRSRSVQSEEQRKPLGATGRVSMLTRSWDEVFHGVYQAYAACLEPDSAHAKNLRERGPRALKSGPFSHHARARRLCQFVSGLNFPTSSGKSQS